MENPRKYGKPPYKIIVVHGGPGAAGEMAPVARELSKGFGVLEPLQTRDSVDGQIREMSEVIKKNNKQVVLIGWSWGAWLAALTAAKFPKLLKKLILVSSGPFEQKYAEGIMKTRIGRFSKEDKIIFDRVTQSLQNQKGNKNKLLKEFGDLLSGVDSFSEIKHKERIKVDERINSNVWSEAEKLRKTGELLKKIEKISVPVIAIHGDYDPHPWQGVKIPLEKKVKDFKFIMLKKCGHHPWHEKYAKNSFYRILRQEILR